MQSLQNLRWMNGKSRNNPVRMVGMRGIIRIIWFITLIFIFSVSYAQDSLHLIATITGEKIGDQFGIVSGVGDVNGDGYDDILIGAPGGRYAKLYFGGTPFDTAACLRFTGDVFVGAGDVNGDGYGDIAVINYYPYYSEVKIYYGGTEFDTIPDISHWKQYFDLYSSLTGVGDVNGDGFDDFIISNSNAGLTCIGCSYHGSYLFLGGDTIKTSPYLTFNASKIGDNFGQSICGCDVNNDGFNDILIGAPGGCCSSDSDSGRVYIYFGGSQMDSVADSVLYRKDCIGNFGSDISNAGDINGDGIDDIFILGGYGSRVFLYLSDDSSIVMSGSSIGVGGDINNDGFNDFVLGGTGYYGGAQLDTSYDFSMEGENKWGRFSKYMAIVGDINGDGYDELVVGTPGFPDYQNPLGKVYVYSYSIGDNVGEKNELNSWEEFKLNQNYPNPFNSETVIPYCLKYTCSVKLGIYSSTGQKIKMLVFGNREKGNHSVSWDGKDEKGQYVASGVYFVRMIVDINGLRGRQEVKTKKILFIK